MTTLQKVLVAAEGAEITGRVEEMLLATGQATIEQARDGTTALALARDRRFELVLTEYPLPELEIVDFLHRLRQPTSTSREAAVVVFAGALDQAELECLGPERLAGVEISTNMRQLLRVVGRGLRLSDRLSARLRVIFDGTTEGFSGRQSVWSLNLSPSGMLLGAEHLLPVGMVAPIAIELSSDEPLIHGQAEVVRHSDPRREGVSGMGMKFVDLFGDGDRRLREFVHDGLAINSDLLSRAR